MNYRIYTWKSQQSSNLSFLGLSKSIEGLGTDLKSRVNYLQKAMESSAERIVCPVLWILGDDD